MKTVTKNSFFLPALIVSLNLILAGRATAQTFTTLHSFTALDQTYFTNSDGSHPQAGLILSGNIFYGTMRDGSSLGYGTVFAVNNNGSGFTNLYIFTGGNDGANPEAGLILSGNTLYGTAHRGGSSGLGTVFAVNTDGSAFRQLHSFTARSGALLTNSDGAFPVGRLTLSGNALYGTATVGGSSGEGTVFKVNTNGTGFTNLHSFTALDQTYYTNSDGAVPEAGLILSGNTLYGTAEGGGSGGSGTVFAINTDGTGFTNLYTFTADDPYTQINGDGANPSAELILSGITLCGTTYAGGTNGAGTVFKVNTNGLGFTNLHTSDGLGAGLILSSNTLYGTTEYGGINGTVFAVNIDGTDFATLHVFTAASGPYPSTNSDGALPDAQLILSGNSLYGTTIFGGNSGSGTLFALSAIFVPITASPATGVVPLTVNFSSSGVNNFGNAITNRNWNFGDGTTSTVQNPSHTYTAPGNFSANFLATNNNGVPISETSLFITVAPPTIQYTASPTNGPIPLTVQFNSPGVDIGGSAISRWNWTFGDGSTSTAQNPLHIYTDTNVGTFHPSLIATNILGLTVAGSGPAISAPVNSGLVVSGGFETGDFFGWTLSGDTSPWTFVDNGSQQSIVAPSSGSYLAALGTTDSRGYLTQTLATTAGTTYLLSCWLDSPDGLTPNEFLVSWDGNILFDQTDLPAIGWTNLQFVVTVTGTSTVLQFGFRDDPSYLGLDDISVVPAQGSVSAPQLTIIPSGANVILTWPTNVAGFDYSGFTLQSATNLVSPAGWTTVSPASVVVNGQNAVTNPISGTQKFFRLSQ